MRYQSIRRECAEELRPPRRPQALQAEAASKYLAMGESQGTCGREAMFFITLKQPRQARGINAFH